MKSLTRACTYIDRAYATDLERSTEQEKVKVISETATSGKQISRTNRICNLSQGIKYMTNFQSQSDNLLKMC